MTGLKQVLLLERKYNLALEFVSASCQWCASSRGRKRMTKARDRWPRDTRGPTSPTSYSSRGESSTLHLATLVSPVQPSLQIFLKISVLPPVFLLCSLSCTASQGDLKQKSCAHQASKRQNLKGLLTGGQDGGEGRSALAPSPCLLNHLLISVALKHPQG